VLLQAFPDPSVDVSGAIAIAVSRLDLEALAGLIDPLVDSPDGANKLALIRTLRRSRSSQAVPVLQRLLGDRIPAVRAAAIEAVERVGRSGPERELAVAAVSGGLQDPADVVRASAIDACGRSGERQYGERLISLLEEDPSPLVRERAALAAGLLPVSGGEGALIAACRRAEPVNVRAAAALAAGVFDRQGIVARVVEMPDGIAVRGLLRERLKRDARFRLLGRRLPPGRRLELRALSTPDDGEAQTSLARGVRSMLDAGERVRLIGSLRAFQGEQTGSILLQIVREDPGPEVRAAALTAVADLLDPEDLVSVGARSLGDPSVLVRRTAVALFARVPPARALARLIQLLRPHDDPSVLAAAAGLAEAHFPVFAQVALRLPQDSEGAVLVIRIARHIAHPELLGLLPTFAGSSSPEVRAAVADLWRNRPDTADATALEALILDPEISVRRAAAGAALAAERYDLLETMVEDPDAGVRREVALVLGRAAPVQKAGLITLDRLTADPDMTVRAGAYVARLTQGIALPFPPELDAQVAAQAVREGADLPGLRRAARTAASEEARLAAGLALALLQDDVAREVARTDPAPTIRHRVSGALELSMVGLPGSSP
jgi:HEAT repeat protein